MEKEEESNNLAVATPPVVELEEEEGVNKRETWGRAFDFLLACIGFSVGLGNVWRFPYLCYKNGGGAFLIPYFLCVIFGGIPLFYLEVALGQFMGVGGLKAWNLVPLLQGIGMATVIIVFLLNCYYNVILCWAFYYMFSSFTTELPWATCNHDWNTENCSENFVTAANIVNGTNSSDPGNIITNLTDPNITQSFVDPVTEYWEHKVLGISSGIDDMGSIKWDLCLCLIFAWIVVYACICKGIKSSGKVMYVTATSPYIFMLCLLIRNALLDGAYDGVIFYLRPNISKLADIQVWVDAGTQIFFSYSISLGALTALGSYNKFHHNSYRDAVLFALTNSGTSFFAGFIVFTILGYMAKTQGRSIEDVAESGPGLAFIAYPKAVAQMPAAPVWSILFFLMIILLGLDSQFVGVEGVITAVVDQYPKYLRKGYRKEIFIGIVCFLSFLIGLSMVTNGGMYVFQLFDYYSGSRIILLVAFFELIAIGYIYGVNRFLANIEMMLGWNILPFMKVCWLVFSPIFCISIFVMSAINYSELTYERPSGVYVYPNWAVAIGWTMACLSIVWVPIIAVYKYIKCRDLMVLLRPTGLKQHQMRPCDYGQLTYDDVLKQRQGLPVSIPQYVAPATNMDSPPPAYVNPGYEKDKESYFTQL
ncbi:sodium- and chloride-dependent GABA transporter 2-like [Haliotis rufescens]|uniref:sodium- and chloride-dependent GABA transporter 2-like n=1 Tax=Haliotis rufescens TaxID=6454 RepID=UPI001EAFF1A3|nr:sodium- and chloride-dependent GABA transporter 2-like [Haliotis rufescens]